jgi:uncharacterized lipoprotein YddW (UPF0748 family)
MNGKKAKQFLSASWVSETKVVRENVAGGTSFFFLPVISKGAQQNAMSHRNVL